MTIAKASFYTLEDYAEIKAGFGPGSYIECGNCGAVKVEARELARVLNSLGDDEWWDIGCELSHRITEYTPIRELDDDAFAKWYEAHEKSICNFDSPDECEYYVKYSEVVLYSDSNCPCFNKITIPLVYSIISKKTQTLSANLKPQEKITKKPAGTFNAKVLYVILAVLMIPVAFISISAVLILGPIIAVIFIGFKTFKGPSIAKIFKIILALMVGGFITYCVSRSSYGPLMGW